jgi:hypothetical protein
MASSRRVRPAVEPVVTAHDRPLAVAQRAEQPRQLIEVRAPRHHVVGVLGARIGEHVAEARGSRPGRRRSAPPAARGRRSAAMSRPI